VIRIRVNWPFREWPKRHVGGRAFQKQKWLIYVKSQDVRGALVIPRTCLKEINFALEPVIAEFLPKRRSFKRSWLNIKQLLERHAKAGEFICTRLI
jgi:hypothetical protein